MTRRFWTQQEERQLALQYPHMQTKVIAILLGRPLAHVYAKAQQLGLRKSDDYLASPAACRLRRGDQVGKSYRFPKGHVPANKGLRRPGFAAGRMKETQFRKGHRPHTWKPIGSERINADGYRDRKVTDTGYPPRDWVGVHRLNWIAAHGPIPPGHVVCFKDGDKLNTAPENLQLLTLVENMRRNTLHNLPKPIVEAIQLAAALKRQINRKERHGQQDRGPA